LVNLSNTGDITVERRDELINKVAEQVVKRGLETPATFFVEMNRPLSFIGGQGLIFLAPILGVIFNQQTIEEFGRLMEDRKNIDRLLDRIEDLSKQQQAEQKEWIKRQREKRAMAKGLPPEAAEPKPLLVRVRSFLFGAKDSDKPTKQA